MYCWLYSFDETFYNIFHHVQFLVMTCAYILINLNSLADFKLFENFVYSISCSKYILLKF